MPMARLCVLPGFCLTNFKHHKIHLITIISVSIVWLTIMGTTNMYVVCMHGEDMRHTIHWQAYFNANDTTYTAVYMKWVHQCCFFQFIFEQKKTPMLKWVLDIYQSFWIEISIRIWINSRIHLYFVSDKKYRIVCLCKCLGERQKENEPKTLIRLIFRVISKVHFEIRSECVCLSLCIVCLSGVAIHKKSNKKEIKTQRTLFKKFYCFAYYSVY